MAGVCLAVVTAVSACTAPESGEDGKIKVAILVEGVANDGGFFEAGTKAALKAAEAVGGAPVHVQPTVKAGDAERVIRSFAGEGYDLVIAWSYIYADAVFRAAKDFPDSHFLTAAPAEKATANVETWSYDALQWGYLTGYLAGQTKLSPLGIVDGPRVPFLEEQWHGFTQGLKASNPSATLLPPIYTDSFIEPERARQATLAQVNSGAKLVAANAEGYATGVIAAAAAAKIATVGLAGTTSDLAASVNTGRLRLELTKPVQGLLERIKNRSFADRPKGIHSTIADGAFVLADIRPVAAAPDMPADIEQRFAAEAGRLARGEITLQPWKP